MQGQFLCQVIGLSRINFGEGMPRFARIHVLQSVRPEETDKRGQEEIRLVMPYEMFDTVSAFPMPGLWRITVGLSKSIDWAPEHGGMVRPHALAAEPVSPERPITGPGEMGQFQVVGLSRFDLGDGLTRFARIHILQSVRPEETGKRGQEEIRLVMPYEMFDTVAAYPIPGLWRIAIGLSNHVAGSLEQSVTASPYALAAEPVPPVDPMEAGKGETDR